MIKISKTLSEKERNRYTKLLKEFVDIFAWSNEDLKTYNTSIIEHKIPLKENTKPFRQNIRRLNPTLLPVTEKRVKQFVRCKDHNTY